MATSKFAVVGHPIAHSLSPKMHAANFDAIGFDGTYEKFDVPSIYKLFYFLRKKRDEGYRGINVTVPYKLAVIPMLDHVDETVKRFRACNTIRFEEDGSMSGFNTDVTGFLSCLARHGYLLGGKKVFIVGCGGAGSALAAACCYENVAQLTVADVDVNRARVFAEGFSNPKSGVLVRACKGSDKTAWSEEAGEADIVINATPLGLHDGDESALTEQAFHKGQFVLDIVPTKTFPPTAALAKKMGADAADGLEFLVAQGAKSFEIWTGLTPDSTAMLKAIRPGSN